MPLKVNAVIRIAGGNLDGVHRIIALPAGSDVAFLFRLAQKGLTNNPECEKSRNKPSGMRPQQRLVRAPVEVLSTLEKRGMLEEVFFDAHPKYLLSAHGLSDKEKKVYEERCKLALPFLDHQVVCEALLSSRGIGKLIAQIRASHSVSRSSCYRLWELLCRYGFHLGALNPRFDKCGAPGKLRPWTEGNVKAGRKTRKERLGMEEPFPQVGVTEEVRKKILATYKVLKRDPKLKFRTIYLKTIDNCFARVYQETSDGLAPVTLTKGTYPTEGQVRRIITQETTRLARRLTRTTVGHFNRNHRGLIGKSWEGVAGPGHVYAIDSTVGDIFLRSNINRAWSIGRPIVYIVVDVWSTAIVGFHVCLSGPSWATAKVALFSTASSSPSHADLWGYEAIAQLNPAPTLPHAFLCDRGEYLSKGAKATGDVLGVNMYYNPSYRPDLKGIVEVLHRIAKDQQFQFVPGAIDARRKEIEIRSNPRDSVFTLNEYVMYLSEIFTQYNFFSNRTHRITTDMMVAGVDPSPAGLWQYGHEVGLGYQKQQMPSQLLTELLPSQKAIIRKDGVYFGMLQYSSPIVHEKEWPALARNFGVMEQSMHYFPGNNSKIWWNDPDKGILEMLTLSPTSLAAPGISFDEWLDAREYDRAKASDKEHSRIVNALAHLSRTRALVENAKEETSQADLAYYGPLPKLRDAKSLEAHPPQLTPPLSEASQLPNNDGATNGSTEAYESLMAELFSLDPDDEAGR